LKYFHVLDTNSCCLFQRLTHAIFFKLKIISANYRFSIFLFNTIYISCLTPQLKQIRDYWSPGNRVAGAYNHHRRNAGGLSGDLLGHGCEVPVRGHRHRRREADDGQRLWGEWVYDHHRATANNDGRRRGAFCLRHDELHGTLWISGSRCPNYRTRFRLGL